MIDELIKIKKEKKLSYNSIAKGSGLSRQTVTNILKKKHDPRWSILKKLVNYLTCK